MTKKALVVEGSEEIRRALCALLAMEGYDSVACVNPEQAQAYLDQPPDWLFLDVDQPGAVDFLRQAKAAHADIQVAMLVTSPESPALPKAQALGASRFILKRPSVLAFVRALSRCIHQVNGHAPGAAARILVVDDEDTVRNVLQRFLKSRGFEVETAVNGVDALAKIKSHKPALVLLDMSMPELDGLSTLAEIKRFDPDMGVIMVTANVDEEKARECILRGASDYITKPLDFEYLENSVLSKILLLSS